MFRPECCALSRFISTRERTDHVIRRFERRRWVNALDIVFGKTALSFGLGLKAPVVSWGVLLTSAQNFRTVARSPWLLILVLFVVATVVTFMFLGDGLRDAADPYR